MTEQALLPRLRTALGERRAILAHVGEHDQAADGFELIRRSIEGGVDALFSAEIRRRTKTGDVPPCGGERACERVLDRAAVARHICDDEAVPERVGTRHATAAVPMNTSRNAAHPASGNWRRTQRSRMSPGPH